MRIRFGFRNLVPFFPNASVFVRQIKASDYQGIANAVETLKQVLQTAGMSDIAAKLFVEAS